MNWLLNVNVKYDTKKKVNLRSEKQVRLQVFFNRILIFFFDTCALFFNVCVFFCQTNAQAHVALPVQHGRSEPWQAHSHHGRKDYSARPRYAAGPREAVHFCWGGEAAGWLHWACSSHGACYIYIFSNMQSHPITIGSFLHKGPLSLGRMNPIVPWKQAYGWLAGCMYISEQEIIQAATELTRGRHLL